MREDATKIYMNKEMTVIKIPANMIDNANNPKPTAPAGGVKR